jgi:hypothetical protein
MFACGTPSTRIRRKFDAAALPALFGHGGGPPERIERLVREVFGIYERGAAQFHAIRRDADVHPRVAQDRDALEEMLSAIVNTALEPLDVTDQDRALTRALVDLNTWEALRSHALAQPDRVAAISDVLATRLSARQG